jgi:hypothetical protein
VRLEGCALSTIRTSRSTSQASRRKETGASGCTMFRLRADTKMAWQTWHRTQQLRSQTTMQHRYKQNLRAADTRSSMCSSSCARFVLELVSPVFRDRSSPRDLREQTREDGTYETVGAMRWVECYYPSLFSIISSIIIIFVMRSNSTC